MKKIMYLLPLFMWVNLLTFNVFSQQITNEEVFPIKDYSVFEMGYPLMVAPGGGDDFMYIEYWPANIARRAEDNYYLQKYRITDYSEIWFKPLTQIGYDQIPEVLGLYKLDKKFAVIGHQFSNKEKRFITVSRFFDFDGKSPELEPTLISKYGKGAPKKDIKEDIYISPTDKSFMWFATSGSKNYATAWSGTTGQNLWEKEIVLPMGDKYSIKDAAIDDKGNATFLLMANKLSYSRKDTALKPYLCRFNPTSGKMSYQKLPLDSTTYMLWGKIKLLNNDEAVVAGVLSDYDAKVNAKVGVLNGAKAGMSERWTHFYCSRFKLSADSMNLAAQDYELIPDEWAQKYQSGSNFTHAQLVVEPGVITKGIDPTAVLVFEEQYKQDDKTFFCDIGYVGMRTNNGSFAFADFISKKQRDQGTGQYLSYALGKTKGKLNLVYITEMGASGKLLAQSIDMKTGKRTEKFLANNDQSLYYFFPSRSKMVSPTQMILIGVGNPSQNNYKFVTITF